MTERSDEAYVGLACAGKIENRQIGLVLDGTEELIQPVAGARRRLGGGGQALFRRIEGGRTSFGTPPVSYQRVTFPDLVKTVSVSIRLTRAMKHPTRTQRSPLARASQPAASAAGRQPRAC